MDGFAQQSSFSYAVVVAAVFVMFPVIPCIALIPPDKLIGSIYIMCVCLSALRVEFSDLLLFSNAF